MQREHSEPIARLSSWRLMGYSVVTLIPVLLLGGFGLYSIRQDRAEVLRAARMEATRTLESLTPLIQAGLSGGLLDPSSTLGMTNPPLTLLIASNGDLLEPRDYPSVPVPAQWVAELTPSQAEHLRYAESVVDGHREGSSQRQVAWKVFLADSPAASRAYAQLEMLRGTPDDPSSTRSDALRQLCLTSDQAASGVPVAHLAFLEWLTRGATGPEEALPVLEKVLIQQPGTFIPHLLRQVSQRWPSASLGRLNHLWLELEEARSMYAAIRPKLVRTLPAGPPQPFWFLGTEGPALVVPREEMAEPGPGSPTRWRLRTVRQSEIARRCREIEQRFSPQVPAFARLELEIPTPDLPGVLATPAFASATVLSQLDSELAAGTGHLTIRTRIRLADEPGLYRAQSRRAYVLGGLVLLATGTAVLGLFVLGRAFRQQVRLAQEQSNFVSSVSHELRAPIAAVSLLTENLVRGDEVKDGDGQRRYFQLILRECRRLSSLVENVLDLARIEQGRKEYEFEPTDVSLLARNTLDLMSLPAAQQRVRLELREEGRDDAPACLDGQAIQRALVNLLDNAIKHSPVDTTIVLGVRRSAGEVRFEITDSGPGIPMAEQQRIFERFYRRGSELTRQTEGVGLGLAIVKHIAVAHGGRVELSSSPGQGSTFTIVLPVQRPASGENL